MQWEVCNAKAREVEDKRGVGCANGQRRELHAACACYVEQQLQDELRAESLASSSSAWAAHAGAGDKKMLSRFVISRSRSSFRRMIAWMRESNNSGIPKARREKIISI